MEIDVVVTELSKLTTNGACDVLVNAINSDEFSIVVNGMGKVKADGVVKKLYCRMNGAGKIDLSKLKTSDCDVKINGAGLVEVSAVNSLQSKINGLGQVGNHVKIANHVKK